ncbi:MAG: Rne/Rng family ribonuclease, partial [Betaproteobacteria bacterium]|nr:Rne/Rng family ribonuclease [Betaproteobacteria bacterium]
NGMSIIARTAGIGRTFEELQWDLNYLLQLWSAIENASNLQKGAFLIYQEGSLVIRAIRDYYQPDIGEILIDTPDIYEQAVQFMNHVMPATVARVKLYSDDVPLFSRFQIEHQIETAFSREVRLPSGGAVVIDHTEALVSVDVNSGRATKGSDIEQTAFNTNLEAAEEVARQLRLRDLGGLVVIDFIDMESPRNQREVENRLRDALHYDRARVQTGKISRFGLMELSRQRLRPSLGESNHIPCPRCHGTGHIRGIESTALHILRIVQEESMKENTGAVQVQLPVEVATFLLNEKRSDIHAVEQRMDVNVILIPNIHLETPNYTIVRLREDETGEKEVARSYQLVEMPTETEESSGQNKQQEVKPMRQEAAVKGITPAQPAPVRAAAATPSIFGRFKSWLGRITAAKEVESEDRPRHRPTSNPRRDRNERGGRGGRGGRDQTQRSGAMPEHKPQEARPPRPPRPEREKAPVAANPNTEVTTEREDLPQRSRRSRGGRGRNRGDRPAREPSAQTPLANENKVPMTPEMAATPAPVVEKVVIPEVQVVAPPVAVEIAIIPEVPAEAPATKKSRAPARRKASPKPIVADLASVGLEMVETHPEKAAAVAVVKEEPTPRKAPKKSAAWQKKAAADKATEEPLVMVETQK